MDRWLQYDREPVVVGDGWRFDPVTAPSRLGGSNGMTIGPDGRLYVTQVFGSQVTAIDVSSGEHEVFSPLGGGIVAPDDGIFGADGTFYATEPFLNRVTARNPDGSYRVVRDDLPAANGITLDHARRRLFVDEFRPGGRLLEVDPTGRDQPRVLMEDLNGPNALAMGPDGRLYFPQVFAGEIWVYDLDAGRGERFAEGLSTPTAVKFDSQGRIVTSEAGAGRITAIDLGTGRRETLAEVPKGIDNVSVGADDRIFVSHYVSGRVAEETSGRQRVLSEPGLLGPHGLHLARDDRLLVADGLSVASVSGDGRIERVLTLLIELHTLAGAVCEVGDDLLVGTPVEVLRYAKGATGPVELVGGLAGPTCLVADGDGAALVVERIGGRVRRIRLDGAIDVVVDGLQQPGAVARGEAGDLHVTQGAGRPLVVLHPDGSRDELAGFIDAQGVAISGGTLLVADAGAHDLVAVDVHSGARHVAVHHAPIGQPVDGIVPAAFCSICPDGRGGFFVSCNGDGSIRRLSRA